MNIRTSETFSKISQALAKAQAAMGPLYKDATNPAFRSSYATLAQVYSTAMEPLTSNGLAVIQLPGSHMDEAGGLWVDVITRLALDDEFIESTLSMRPVKADPQGMGSAITYARRYALMAMVGLAPDDDDGNGASESAKTQKAPPKAQKAVDGDVEFKSAAPTAPPAPLFVASLIPDGLSETTRKVIEHCRSVHAGNTKPMSEDQYGLLVGRMASALGVKSEHHKVLGILTGLGEAGKDNRPGQRIGSDMVEWTSEEKLWSKFVDAAKEIHGLAYPMIADPVAA